MTIPSPIAVHEADVPAWRTYADAAGYDVDVQALAPTFWLSFIARDGSQRPPDAPVPRHWATFAAGAEGIDVSENQLTIEWDKVKAAGIAYAYIRCSATYAEDDKFLFNWLKAWEAGLARGAYHYWRHDADNRLQIERVYRSLLGEGELPVAVDVELRPSEADPPASERQVITDKLREFLLGLEARLGHRPAIYTSPRYWHAMTTRPAWAADYPLWLADWTGGPDYPDSWTWAFLRQYAVTAERSVNGIVTAIDRDRWQGWVQPPAPPPAEIHTLRDRTNQQVINLFWRAFGSWSQLSRAIPSWATSMATTAARPLPYAGPAIEAMDLTPAEKAALIAALP